MNYIVLDLEWNQPVAAALQRTELKGEIIQFGAVRLNEDFVQTGCFEALVKPIVYRKLNSYVKRITGLTREELEQAQGFCAVYEAFEQFCGQDFALITWGPDDIGILKDNLKLHHLPEDLAAHYNLQVVYNAQTEGEKRQVALKEAVAHFNIVSERTAHDALNDALDTAAVLSRLDMKTGLANYATQAKDAFKTTASPLWQKETPLTENPHLAAEQGQQITPLCPVCHAPLVPAFQKKNAFLYFASADCQTHGRYFMRLRILRKGKGKPKADPATGKLPPSLYYGQLQLWPKEDAPVSVQNRFATENEQNTTES